MDSMRFWSSWLIPALSRRICSVVPLPSTTVVPPVAVFIVNFMVSEPPPTDSPLSSTSSPLSLEVYVFETSLDAAAFELAALPEAFSPSGVVPFAAWSSPVCEALLAESPLFVSFSVVLASVLAVAYGSSMVTVNVCCGADSPWMSAFSSCFALSDITTMRCDCDSLPLRPSFSSDWQTTVTGPSVLSESTPFSMVAGLFLSLASTSAPSTSIDHFRSWKLN